MDTYTTVSSEPVFIRLSLRLKLVGLAGCSSNTSGEILEELLPKLKLHVVYQF